MSRFDYLNEEDLKAISLVHQGSDIQSLQLAMALRSVEAKQKEKGHNLIHICECMGEYSANEKHPYFGCIALADGLEATEIIEWD